MHCPKCGTEILIEDAAFCYRCGRKLDDIPQATGDNVGGDKVDGHKVGEDYTDIGTIENAKGVVVGEGNTVSSTSTTIQPQRPAGREVSLLWGAIKYATFVVAAGSIILIALIESSFAERDVVYSPSGPLSSLRDRIETLLATSTPVPTEIVLPIPTPVPTEIESPTPIPVFPKTFVVDASINSANYSNEISLTVDAIELQSNGRMRWHISFWNKTDTAASTAFGEDQSYVTDELGTNYTILNVSPSGLLDSALRAGVRARGWLDFESPTPGAKEFQLHLVLYSYGSQQLRYDGPVEVLFDSPLAPEE